MPDTVSPVDDGGAVVLDTELTRPHAAVALLRVSGEIDTLTAPRLEVALARMAAEATPVQVVDLSAVVFLASSGLAVLIEAAHRTTAAGRTLRLVVQGRPVLRALQITGTDRLFDVRTDRAAALLPHPVD